MNLRSFIFYNHGMLLDRMLLITKDSILRKKHGFERSLQHK